MFSELKGKTLTKRQLIDWSITKNTGVMTVEEIIIRAIEFGANIIGLSIYQQERVNKIMSEKKISREQLLDLYKKYGTGKEAEKIIAEETNCTVSTISTYIGKWGIRKEINGNLTAPTESQEQNISSKQLAAVSMPTTQSVEAVKEIFKGVKGYEDKPKLKIRVLEGKISFFTVNEADHSIIITIFSNGKDIEVSLNDFDKFYEEITEIKECYLQRIIEELKKESL